MQWRKILTLECLTCTLQSGFILNFYNECVIHSKSKRENLIKLKYRAKDDITNLQYIIYLLIRKNGLYSMGGLSNTPQSMQIQMQCLPLYSIIKALGNYVIGNPVILNQVTLS